MDLEIHAGNFLHVHDLIKAIEIIINSGTIGEVYNIGCNNEHSVLEIADLLLKFIKPKEELNNWIEFVEDRPFNDSRYLINSDKIINLGWNPNTDFIDGIYNLIFATKIDQSM